MKSYLTIKLQLKSKSQTIKYTDIGLSKCSDLPYFSKYKDSLDSSKIYYCPEKLNFELQNGKVQESLALSVSKCTDQNKLLPKTKYCKGSTDSYINSLKIESFEVFKKDDKIHQNQNLNLVLETGKMWYIKNQI